VIFNLPLKADPLESVVSLPVVTTNLAVEISANSSCDYYCAIKMQGITVGPSPDWLRARLEAVGQRSINNLVDATNYVMLDLGQPLHAFAAAKIMPGADKITIGVRQATSGEKFTTLTGEICTLNEADTLIVNADNNEALALAGVKGGQAAAVDETTTEIILEAAHFNRQAVRLTARRLNLLTDAAKRYENGVSAGLVPIGLIAAAKLIGEVAGGHVVGFASAGKLKSEIKPLVKVALTEINSLLGLTLTLSDVEAIIKRFGYARCSQRHKAFQLCLQSEFQTTHWLSKVT
jgi:phenylalanyl-tRNA synthetase beta chain